MKPGARRLDEIGEDALVRGLTAGLSAGAEVVAGPGDDCAVLKGARGGFYDLFKADCVVEGVHYESGAPPAQVGWKAMARSISDVAAMSGVPRHAVVTLVLPVERTVSYVKALYRGMEKAARRYSVSIVGGETSRAPRRGGGMISVALLGEVERRRCVFRDGGRPGDLLFVTGELGAALVKGRHLKFVPRVEEARWLTEHFPLHAMMDLSDGLAKDLPRLARASGTGFELDRERIPRARGCSEEQALGEGEDYELVFALSARHGSRLESEWAEAHPETRLTRIGRLASSRSAGKWLRGGWEHFGVG